MLLVLLASALAHAAAASVPPPTALRIVEPADPLRDRLLDHLKTIPTKRSALGDADHRQGLLDTETWLKARLNAIGLKHEPHEFVWNSPALKAALIPQDDPAKPAEEPAKDDSKFHFRNHIVDLPGTDLAHEVLILGAHYDAVPESPGADDNASGVAALIEAGRALKDAPRRRTIRLIFFTLEEVGLIGSVNYVLHKKADWAPPPADTGNPDEKAKPRERLIGMVSLECIGYFSDAEGSQKNPIPKIGDVQLISLDVPKTGNFLGIAGVSRHQSFSRAFADAMRTAEPTLPLLAADMLPIAPPDFLRSDHAPFLLAGLPAMMLTNTANFRNPNYHRPSDTPDTLDPDRFAKATRAVVAAALVLANPSVDPVNNPGDKPTPAK
jgi:hypothetical protein